MLHIISIIHNKIMEVLSDLSPEYFEVPGHNYTYYNKIIPIISEEDGSVYSDEKFYFRKNIYSGQLQLDCGQFWQNVQSEDIKPTVYF